MGAADADKLAADIPLDVDHCCCGFVRIQTAAYAIGFIELLIIFYNVSLKSSF